jgi:hypothetical protein
LAPKLVRRDPEACKLTASDTDEERHAGRMMEVAHLLDSRPALPHQARLKPGRSGGFERCSAISCPSRARSRPVGEQHNSGCARSLLAILCRRERFALFHRQPIVCWRPLNGSGRPTDCLAGLDWQLRADRKASPKWLRRRRHWRGLWHWSGGERSCRRRPSNCLGDSPSRDSEESQGRVSAARRELPAEHARAGTFLSLIRSVNHSTN